MFSIPGFNVGSLVVEAPKEQLKKRKHDAMATSTTPTSTTTTTTTTTTMTTAATKVTTSTIASTKSATAATAATHPQGASNSTTTTTATTATAAAAALKIAPSTSNAPFSKKFKKEPVFEKRPPSEPKLGWGWIPEPVPLKERASWNRPTKALGKAKAAEERVRKEKALEEKKDKIQKVVAGGKAAEAVELLLQGEVDLKDIAGGAGRGRAVSSKKGAQGDQGDTEMTEAPKKRNKRLERKIKRAAYIAAIESSSKKQAADAEQGEENTASGSEPMVVDEEQGQDATTNDNLVAKEDEAETGSGEGEHKKEKKEKKPKPAPAPVHPEIAKLTNKEKRLLKQFQKKQRQEGVDLAATADAELLKPQPQLQENNNNNNNNNNKKKKKAEGQNKVVEKKAESVQPVTKETTKAAKKESSKKVENEVSKKQQQLAKEREKLLEALNRTNDALAELQGSLGDGEEDESPLKKADVKAAVQGKKEKKDKKEKAAPPAPAPAPATPATSATTSAKPTKLTKLQEQMKKTLAGGKFRFLNEQLYTTTGEEAFTLFQSKPELFDEYHEGFRSQVEAWPQNPVDIFISQLQKMPKDTVIADLGCGDAQISKELTKHKNVLSFDLVAKNERVTACDIAHLPLEDSTVDVAVFCLSLMGTDFLRFLKEAYRVLKPNGQLKISEVISRFTDVDAFVDALKALGFELKNSDSSNKMFIMFDFIKPDLSLIGSKKGSKKAGNNKNKKQKVQEDQQDVSEVDVDAMDGASLLKPCIYKKR
ncbi:25S rRNA (adenine645-N1)-methyltransferase [Mortierella claussenii]|nr:25S rRNA (adenine645-N1)-methyltransferase [Mortierella claussenii]